MYKRRGRVLFLDLGAGTRARMAQAWAEELGGQWVTAGTAALVSGTPAPGLARVMAEVEVAAEAAPCPAWSSAREAGWDLVVVLDTEGRQDWPPRLEGARAKPWHLDGACPADDEGPGMEELRHCRDTLRGRVEGLLGGFRLKAREDDSRARIADDGEPR